MTRRPCYECCGTALEWRIIPAGPGVPARAGHFLCSNCNGRGWFEEQEPAEALFHNVMQPGLHKAVAAWSVLFVMKVAHAWLGVAVHKLERWVAS